MTNLLIALGIILAVVIIALGLLVVFVLFVAYAACQGFDARKEFFGNDSNSDEIQPDLSVEDRIRKDVREISGWNLPPFELVEVKSQDCSQVATIMLKEYNHEITSCLDKLCATTDGWKRATDGAYCFSRCDMSTLVSISFTFNYGERFLMLVRIQC